MVSSGNVENLVIETVLTRDFAIVNKPLVTVFVNPGV